MNKTTTEVKELREKIKKATADLKLITKRRLDAKRSRLSSYTMDAIQEEYSKAVGAQMDEVFKLREMVVQGKITMDDAERYIKADTK